MYFLVKKVINLMKIETIKAVFGDEELFRILVADKAKEGKDTYIAKNIVRCISTEGKEKFVQLFLDSIGAQKGLQHEKAATVLLDAVLGELKHLKTPIPAAIASSLDAISKCFKKGIYKEPVVPGKFPDSNLEVSKLLDAANDEYCPHEIEQLILDHAAQDEAMKERAKTRKARHEAAFSYDVVRTKKMAKLLVCGTPRSDRENCLADFYKMLMQEEADVVVTLNTFSDWNKAIRYYDADVLSSLQDEMKVTVVSEKVFYRGLTATNLPKGRQEEPRESEALSEYRVRLEERAIKIESNGKERTITHLHYVNWPDHEEAPDEKALSLLLDRHMELPGASVVHCQGGIGRTLGYVQTLYLRHKLKREQQKGSHIDSVQINIPKFTYKMKEQAPRLGGSPKSHRMAQVLRMTYAYAQQLKSF